jgi:WD40 repeat protein
MAFFDGKTSRMWDIASGKEIDDNTLNSSSRITVQRSLKQGLLEIIDSSSGIKLASIAPQAKHRIDTWVISPDGKILAVGATDKTIRLYDLKLDK